MPRIDGITLRLLKIPLREPYKLAFGPVTHFDTVLSTVTIEGHVGYGEATLLTGYTDETTGGCWNAARRTVQGLIGLSGAEAKARIAEVLADAPFTATMLASAIEMAEGHPALELDKPSQVPLLFGINAVGPGAIESEIDQAVNAGFDTLKIKAGFDLEDDLQRVRFIQKYNAGRARLRIDANQGYRKSEGCRFASSLQPEDIELLEQPCPAQDWEANAAVIGVSNVPLMLDESIYTRNDIERAAEIGASFVKLKLMKCGSITDLEEGLAHIRSLGMEPVLGNGVASDIGCWMEACVARRRVHNSGEMNGFLRQKRRLFGAVLKMKGGAVELAPRDQPRPDAGALARATRQSVHFGAVDVQVEGAP